MRDEHDLPLGYANAIVHEYDMNRAARRTTLTGRRRPPRRDRSVDAPLLRIASSRRISRYSQTSVTTQAERRAPRLALRHAHLDALLDRVEVEDQRERGEQRHRATQSSEAEQADAVEAEAVADAEERAATKLDERDERVGDRARRS